MGRLDRVHRWVGAAVEEGWAVVEAVAGRTGTRDGHPPAFAVWVRVDHGFAHGGCLLLGSLHVEIENVNRSMIEQLWWLRSFDVGDEISRLVLMVAMIGGCGGRSEVMRIIEPPQW